MGLTGERDNWHLYTLKSENAFNLYVIMWLRTRTFKANIAGNGHPAKNICNTITNLLGFITLETIARPFCGRLHLLFMCVRWALSGWRDVSAGGSPQTFTSGVTIPLHGTGAAWANAEFPLGSVLLAALSRVGFINKVSMTGLGSFLDYFCWHWHWTCCFV